MATAPRHLSSEADAERQRAASRQYAKKAAADPEVQRRLARKKKDVPLLTREEFRDKYRKYLSDAR